MTIFIIACCITGILSIYRINKLLSSEEQLMNGYKSGIKLLSYVKDSHHAFVHNSTKTESEYVNTYMSIVVDNKDILDDVVHDLIVVWENHLNKNMGENDDK